MTTGQWEGGKGSKARSVDKKKFDTNWDNIFGKKDQKPSIMDKTTDKK